MKKTAENILKNRGIERNGTDSFFYERALDAMKSIADKAWEAGNTYAKDLHQDEHNNNRKDNFMKELFNS